MFAWNLKTIALYIFNFTFFVNATQNNSDLNELYQNKYFTKNISDNNTTISETSKKITDQVLMKQCLREYSLTCFYIDLNKLLDRLKLTRSIRIFPGILLVSAENLTNINEKESSINVIDSMIRSNRDSDDLNSYIMQKLSNYLESLTVKVNLLDTSIFQQLKQMAFNVFNSIFYPVEESGRSKKQKHDVHAAVWSAAMLAALAFSGLATLAGKAMLTGAVALILSLICLLKGCHGGSKAAHYEIITKPGHLHDVEHIGYTSALGSSPYSSYARHLIQDRVIPAINILDTDASEEKDLETKIIPVHAYQISSNLGSNSLVHR